MLKIEAINITVWLGDVALLRDESRWWEAKRVATVGSRVRQASEHYWIIRRPLNAIRKDENDWECQPCKSYISHFQTLLEHALLELCFYTISFTLFIFHAILQQIKWAFKLVLLPVLQQQEEKQRDYIFGGAAKVYRAARVEKQHLLGLAMAQMFMWHSF